MRSIVTDREAWYVGRSVTLVSPVKTGEPIDMPFGLRTRVGSGNHVLDGECRSPIKMGNCEGNGRHIVQGHFVAICAKTTEPIEMPFPYNAQGIMC